MAQTQKNGQESGNWWGAFPIGIGNTHRWYLGGLDLSVTRLKREWEINYSYARPALGQTGDEFWHKPPEIALNSSAPAEPEVHHRLACQATGDKLRITPKMANRSLVTRPWDVLQILPGEEATLFVGAPLWLELSLSDEKEHSIEIPIRNLSDTWFGPSPRRGELCYDSRTHGFTERSQLVNRPYRALVPVRIQNLEDSLLRLERMNLPVPFLDLYRDAENMFWSQGITLTREQDRKNVRIEIDRSAPDYVRDAELVSRASETSDTNLLTKTFDMLFA